MFENVIQLSVKWTTKKKWFKATFETADISYVVDLLVTVRVIGHLYSALLWDEPIAKALRYGP